MRDLYFFGKWPHTKIGHEVAQLSLDSTVYKESETLGSSVLSIHCWLIFTSQVFHTLRFWGLLQTISVFVCMHAWASTQAWVGNRFTLLHVFFRKGYINRILALSPGPLWLSLKEIIHHDSGWLLSLQGTKTAESISGIHSKGTPQGTTYYRFPTLHWRLFMRLRSLPAQITAAELAWGTCSVQSSLYRYRDLRQGERETSEAGHGWDGKTLW